MTAFAASVDLPSTKDTAGQQADALNRATDLIRGALGGQQIIRVDDDTTVLKGNGRRILQLPQIPVVSVTSVTINQGGYYPNLLTPGIHYTVDAGGRLRALGYPWPSGWDITVVYTHGYDTVPEELSRLCAALADKILAGTLGVRSMQESIGTRQSSVTYAATASSAVFDDSERAVLDKYRPEPIP